MLNDDHAAIRLPDPGQPPLSDPTRLWLYAVTQWRRLFGLNISRIDELLFVGGAFTPAQWIELRALGIRAVLSLQAEREDHFDGTPPERTLRLPVQDFHPPSIDQLHDAVAFILACRADGLPVLVHCHAGVGRASLTASAYLISSGLSHLEAFSRIKRARPIVELNALQLARLIEWEWRLRAQITIDPPSHGHSVDSPYAEQIAISSHS
ncbi:MAG: dual specificity protein phosphatase family protein [Roseiflexaceae bacterium]